MMPDISLPALVMTKEQPPLLQQKSEGTQPTTLATPVLPHWLKYHLSKIGYNEETT